MPKRDPLAALTVEAATNSNAELGHYRKFRMVEIGSAVANHAQPLHHAVRTKIHRHRKRDNLLQPE